MMADLVREALAGGGIAALPLSLAGGLVAGLNPCCLPLYPAAAATCCAARGEGRPRPLPRALAFVAGTAAATTILGVAAALAGRTMTALGGWARYAIALVPLAMAVHLLGWLRLPMPRFEPLRGRSVLGGAFLGGALFSLVLAPCGTPVLASVLSYVAYRADAVYGGLVLFSYGIGAGLPILLVGTAAGRFASHLDARGWRPWVDRAAGVILLALGFQLLWRA